MKLENSISNLLYIKQFNLLVKSRIDKVLQDKYYVKVKFYENSFDRKLIQTEKIEDVDYYAQKVNAKRILFTKEKDCLVMSSVRYIARTEIEKGIIEYLEKNQDCKKYSIGILEYFLSLDNSFKKIMMRYDK